MKLKFSRIGNAEELCAYSIAQETISEKDNYTMYQISRPFSSHPPGVSYHCMYYLEGGKVTPQEMIVNSESGVIETVTIFISKRNDHMVSMTDYMIDRKDFLCGIELDECAADWKSRFHKIVKDSSFLWGECENLLFFIFSDAPIHLNAYPIFTNLQLLADEGDELQGFCLLQP